MSRFPTSGLRREQLPNGVTFLVQRRDMAAAAAIVTHVRAGFLDEPDDLVGVSHVLEHMLFKGTPSLGPGELAQRTKALGGSLNAYTSYDRTVYYASAPARHAGELVALQADQVQHPLLDAGELRRELGVIVQEARRKLDTPDAVASETLHELLYLTHRLRRWRIGAEAELERFSRSDVAGYYASRYVPARAIVALVADMDEEEALATLRAQWSDWSRPPSVIPPGPAEQSVPQVRARRMSGDVVLGEMVLGWRAPGVLDADIPALDIASAVLGLGRGSRLALLLRDRGLVNAVGVSDYGVADAGVFSIGAELDPSHMQSVLEIVGNTLSDLASRGPDAAEFDRARIMLRARLGRRLERFESRALALADAEALGDVTRLDREEAELLAVTPAKVREVAERWLTPNGVSAVAYLPAGSDARFDADLLRETMRRSARASGNAAAGRATRVATGRHTIAPLVVHHRAVGTLDVLTARAGETGQISLSIHRRRNLLETAPTSGLAALALRSMLRGTERYDAGALAVAMESLGGALSPSLGADLIGFGATVLSEYAREVATLLAEVLYRPRFDPEAVGIERALLREDARAVADDMMRFPVQLALGVAFNDTGYGAPSLGTPESVGAFGADDVRRWHARLLADGRTTVVAVGDADPERLAETIAPLFEHSASSRQTSPLDRIEAIVSGTRLERRDRKQSALAMLFPGPARTDPDRFVAETWSAIAAGLGGRLFESLRSARSLAYTVIANAWQRQRAGGLLTYIATDPARLEEARDAMLAELAIFRRDPPSAAELARATAMLIGQVELSRQTAGAVAGEIADAWLLGAGLSELEDPAAPYRAITAEAVHALAARSLDPALRAEGVVAAAAIE